MTIKGLAGPIHGGHRRKASFAFIALVAMVAATTATVNAASPSPVGSRTDPGWQAQAARSGQTAPCT